jgi:hypothetical protein
MYLPATYESIRTGVIILVGQTPREKESWTPTSFIAAQLQDLLAVGRM